MVAVTAAMVMLLGEMPASADTAAAGTAISAPEEKAAPTRYGLAVEFGNTYDPSTDISFLLANGFVLFDYGAFWHQDRPRELRFKIEGSAGASVRPDVKAMASLGIAALYYLDMFAGKELRPYVEGGIGGIYADFRVKGQGLRFNFNPQLSLGAEWGRDEGSNLFTAIRLHHVSNAGLHKDNRGMNSVVLQVGRFF